MASGRLYTGVVTPYNANPVYDVPNGVSKTAFSLVAQGFDDADVKGTVIYKGDTPASVYDTTSPTALANFATSQTFSAIIPNAQIYELPTDMRLPSGYTYQDIQPVYLGASKTAYMTYDQTHIFDLTNRIWRSASEEYGSSAHYVIVANQRSAWTSDPWGILLISSNNPSSSPIYPVNQNTFEIGNYGYWDMNFLLGERTGRFANLQYSIDNDGYLHYINANSNYYAPDGGPFAGINYNFTWNTRENNTSTLDGNTDWAIRLRSNKAVGLDVSNGRFYESDDNLTSWTDNNWSWGGIMKDTSRTWDIDLTVAYPINSTSVMIFKETGGRDDFIWFDSSMTAYGLGIFSSIGSIKSAYDYAGGGSMAIRDTDGNVWIDTSYSGNIGLTEFSDISITAATDLYTSYNVSQVNYSPSLSAGIVSDAFDNNSWLFLANNTTVTTTIQYYNDAGTYGTMFGPTTLSGNTTANVAFTTTQDCIVDGNFISDIVTGNEIELKTGYVEIANSVVSEAFNGSTIEITGRMISANDSIIVYTDKPTKVTVMGIEEEA